MEGDLTLILDAEFRATAQEKPVPSHFRRGSPNERLQVMKFAAQTSEARAEVRSRGIQVLVCGEGLTCRKLVGAEMRWTD